MAKKGPRRIDLIGNLISLVAIFISGFATLFFVVALRRFLAGMAAGFVFPSLVVLITRGNESLGVGLVNVWYNFGSVAGALWMGDPGSPLMSGGPT